MASTSKLTNADLNDLVVAALLNSGPIRSDELVKLLRQRAHRFIKKKELYEALKELREQGIVCRDALSCWDATKAVIGTGKQVDPRLMAIIDRHGERMEVNARNVRPYVRCCTWCAHDIAVGIPAIQCKGSRRGKFCSIDCIEKWDSIYWQRVDLGKRRLSLRDYRQELARIKREQKRLGYGWSTPCVEI